MNNIKLSEKTVSYSQGQKIIEGLSNIYGINVYMLTAGNQDTEFNYWLYTNKKFNKQTMTAIQNFILGVCYCWQ